MNAKIKVNFNEQLSSRAEGTSAKIALTIPLYPDACIPDIRLFPDRFDNLLPSTFCWITDLRDSATSLDSGRFWILKGTVNIL